MSEFIYQEPFPIECDKTQYRLLTKENVKIVECDGRRILKVDPKGIELLAREAYTDVSFYHGYGCGGNDAHNNDNNFSLVFHNKSPVRNMSDFQLTNIT